MFSSVASWQIALAAAVLMASLLWMLPGRIPPAAVLGAALLAGAATWAGVRQARLPAPEEAETQRPVQVAENGYVSSGACQACHPDEFSSWHDSYHRTMTQVVTPQTVATPLEGVEVSSDGISYRFEREGDAYFVVKSGGGPRPQRFPIVMSTGSHHMQIFWMATGQGRLLELVPFHYLIDDDVWIPRRASFVTPPGKNVFGTEWNTGCILCHTTRGQPRIRGREVDSRAVEFGIACEACHGPGEEHIRANQNPERRYRLHLSADGEDSTIVNPRRLSKERSSEVCGRCHAYAVAAKEVRREVPWSGYAFEPGDDLAHSRKVLQRDDLTPFLQENGLSDGRFWSDGVVRGSGREFGAMAASGCYERGEITCLSCHSMHPEAEDARPRAEWANDQLGVAALGDQACLNCHAPIAADVEAHTRHSADSSGSTCYNCHMPHTVLGLLSAIRVHEIHSPSATAALETGRPDACSLCHMDKPLGWTADHLTEWYGQPRPELSPEQETVSASVRWALGGHAAQRAIVAASMGWAPAQETAGSDWMAPYLGQLLEDPYPVVRFIAERSLRSLPGSGELDYDFLADEKHWMQARRDVFETWSASRRGDRNGSRTPVLIDEGGALLEEQFARILAERDDQPVVVVE